MSLPIVAIVGRPNVGKSTLFNKIIKKRLAIQDDQPGITRDRIYADVEWYGKMITLVDTGGLAAQATGDIERLVSQAAETAIEVADKVVFVVDGRVGLVDEDVRVTRMVQKAGVPVVLAVTKIDGTQPGTGMHGTTSS